jgi:hypothetical protein
MNRKQRASVVAGFFLLVVSLLFMPTHPYRSPLVRYSFLFTGQGSIDFARLFAEWVLIALVTAGLFYLLRESTLSKPETRTNSVATSEHTRRRLFSLSIVLSVLIAALGVLSYASIRKIRRLEAEIQSVREMLLPPFIPVGQRFTPIGTLRPLRIPKDAVTVGIAPLGTVNGVPVYTAEQTNQMVQAEYDRVVDSMREQIESKDETLKRIKEQLDKLD